LKGIAPLRKSVLAVAFVTTAATVLICVTAEVSSAPDEPVP
jgi:hypothetical protein